jgi:histidyl-tRNA synthetase
MHRNVFRVLDCKEESCKRIAAEAPTIEGFLDDECREHFQSVCAGLDALGISYHVNYSLVRGLDYYNRTIFEIFPAGKEGRQDALGAGGRYDMLAHELGASTSRPAVGFALGVDRIALELRGRPQKDILVCVAPVFFKEEDPSRASEEERRKIFARADIARDCTSRLRRKGVPAEYYAKVDRVGKKRNQARKRGASHVLIIGGDELAEGKARLQDLSSDDKDDPIVSMDTIAEDVAKIVLATQGGKRT